MDTLVARYSRPAFEENENLFRDEEQQDLDLMGAAPPLSLKFAMPPVAQVRSAIPRPWEPPWNTDTLDPTALLLASRRNRRPFQPRMPH